MSIHRPYIKLSIALALTSVTLFTISASGQSQAARPNSTDKGTNDLNSEITAVKAENAAVRELLRKLEEQQKTLLEQVDRLQQRLGGGTATVVSMADQPIVPPTTADASAPAANASGPHNS
jgi:septal ring factor EnvC (AmiA/AmiB activator)